jgi:hypothetical protein
MRATTGTAIGTGHPLSRHAQILRFFLVGLDPRLHLRRCIIFTGCTEEADLIAGQFTPRADREAAELERADRDCSDLAHREARLTKDLRDVAVLAFLHRDPECCLARLALEDGHVDVGSLDPAFLARSQTLELEHLPAEAVEICLIHIPFHHREIRLGDAIARVGQAVGELAVVGQEDQAGLIPPQPADRKEPGLGRVVDQVQDCPAFKARFIVRGRERAIGLMKDDVELATGWVAGRLCDGLAIDRDLVVSGIDERRELGDKLAVDLDVSFFDQLLADSACGDPCIGKDSLEPDHGRSGAPGATGGFLVVFVIHRASLDRRDGAQVQRFQRARTEKPMTDVPSSSWNARA